MATKVKKVPAAKLFRKPCAAWKLVAGCDCADCKLLRKYKRDMKKAKAK